MVGRTTLIIAHRLSTIRNADKIVPTPPNIQSIQIQRFPYETKRRKTGRPSSNLSLCLVELTSLCILAGVGSVWQWGDGGRDWSARRAAHTMRRIQAADPEAD
jgi:hypothetical protein